MNFTKSLFANIFLFNCLMLISACSDTQESSKVDNVSTLKKHYLKQKRTEVCWMNPEQVPNCTDTHSNRCVLSSLERIVKMEYNDKTNLEFFGFGRCSKNISRNNIKVFIYDPNINWQKLIASTPNGFFTDVATKFSCSVLSCPYGNPQASNVGSPSLNRGFQVVINPSYKNVNPLLSGIINAISAYPNSQLKLINMTASLLLHEIGHVIGLVHAHSHPDNSNLSKCNPVDAWKTLVEKSIAMNHQNDLNEVVKKFEELREDLETNLLKDIQWVQTNLSNLKTLPYDPHSVMNYCKLWSGDFATHKPISEGDIEIINGMYP